MKLYKIFFETRQRKWEEKQRISNEQPKYFLKNQKKEETVLKEDVHMHTHMHKHIHTHTDRHTYTRQK